MTYNKSIRTVLILNFLNQYSSYNHPKTISEISTFLYPYFENVDRKTIRNDLKALIDINYPIIYRHDNNVQGFYIEDTTLTLVQAKLVLDALTSNPSIPNQITKKIINTLSPLIKQEDFNVLTSQQYIPSVNNSKTDFLKQMEVIMHCINNNLSISFQYFDVTSKRKKRYRKDGKRYLLQPYFVFMNAARYYVIGYDAKHNALVHYRLDKMDAIQSTIKNETKPLYDQVNKRIETTISLFTGEYQNVDFSIKPSYLSVFIDQFNEIMIINENESQIHINVTLQVNNALFAWITHFDPNDVKLIGPVQVKEDYKNYLKKIWSSY